MGMPRIRNARAGTRFGYPLVHRFALAITSAHAIIDALPSRAVQLPKRPREGWKSPSLDLPGASDK